MNIYIRADSSTEIGTGHIMRCLTLAEDLKRKGAKVTFICRNLYGNLIRYIKKQGFEIMLLPPPAIESTFIPVNRIDHSHWLRVPWETDMEQTKKILFEQKNIDWLIVDHYSLDKKWEQEMRPFVSNIMVIDDLADRSHDCDLLLDASIQKDMDFRYERLVANNTVMLLGPKYALLRPEFRVSRKNVRLRDGSVTSIFLFFGGSDPTNETLKSLKALKMINRRDINVDVVVGSTNPNKKNIKALCNDLPNIFFHCQIDYMAELMAKADLSIGAGGSTTWERCYLGLPAITIETADNQANILSILDEIGAIFHLGRSEEVSKQDIAGKVGYLLTNPHVLKEMSYNAMKLMGTESDGNPVLHYLLGGKND